MSDPEQTQAATDAAAEAEYRAESKRLLAKAINYVGWDNRMQESDFDLAGKLMAAVESVQAQEAAAAEANK